MTKIQTKSDVKNVKIIRQEEINNDANEIVNLINKILNNSQDNYRKTIAYKLLNLIKVGDKKEFMYVILRTLLANSDKEQADNKISKVSSILNKYYFATDFKEDVFEKIGYAIVMGILGNYQRGE